MIDYSDISKKRGEDIRAQMLEKPARKIKLPKVIAVINQAGCTGCEACIQFCPVDCIEIVPGPKFPDMEKIVEVDQDRCIGCKACAKYCPWDTIEMVASDTAYDIGNEWTLRSVIDPANPTKVWPRPEPVDESAPADPAAAGSTPPDSAPAAPAAES